MNYANRYRVYGSQPSPVDCGSELAVRRRVSALAKVGSRATVYRLVDGDWERDDAVAASEASLSMRPADAIAEGEK